MKFRKGVFLVIGIPYLLLKGIGLVLTSLSISIYSIKPSAVLNAKPLSVPIDTIDYLKKLQGTWESATDHLSKRKFIGDEVLLTYDGELISRCQFRLSDTCTEVFADAKRLKRNPFGTQLIEYEKDSPIEQVYCMSLYDVTEDYFTFGYGKLYTFIKCKEEPTGK
jgi:hypothetical protein